MKVIVERTTIEQKEVEIVAGNPETTTMLEMADAARAKANGPAGNWNTKGTSYRVFTVGGERFDE